MTTQKNHDVPRVLVLLGCFGRGVEASGPNQTLLGMAHALRGEFDFRVVAEAVDGDVLGQWQQVSGVAQYPISKGLAGISQLRDVLRTTPHDLLMTNGLFDRTMTLPMLTMRRLGLIARKPTMLAPHGELSPGAIDLRGGRKRAYLQVIRKLRLLDGVDLIATTEDEAVQIEREGRFATRIWTCPNIYPIPPIPAAISRSQNEILRIVYASRIDEKKNLHGALRLLAKLDQPVRFDIFGPISDQRYWAECQSAIADLPSHIQARHRGILPQSIIHETLAAYDVMFLPTRGENFGYAIADALLAGTPVLISDRTPWRKLVEANAGWDIPLDDDCGFLNALRIFQTMAPEDKGAQRCAARAFAIDHLDVEQARNALRAALHGVLDRRPDSALS